MRDSGGQFFPARVELSNSGQKFRTKKGVISPWDFVLAIEGAFTFGGQASRRLGQWTYPYAAFPFCVHGLPLIDSDSDSERPRAELWLPVWSRPCTYEELRFVVASGRARVGRRPAVTAPDLARAVAGLGVDRGLTTFERFSFIPRNGKAHVAVPVGRFKVGSLDRSKSDLLSELDGWIKRLPEKYHIELDRLIVSICQRSEPEKFEALLAQLAWVCRQLGTSQDRTRLPAPPTLTMAWANQIDDGSREFQLARAVASIQGVGAVPSLVGSIWPCLPSDSGWFWPKTDSKFAVWSWTRAERDLGTVLSRRCLDSQDEPVLALRGRLSCPLTVVGDFLEGRLDELRLARLVPALALLHWRGAATEEVSVTSSSITREDCAILDRNYAALRLLVEEGLRSGSATTKTRAPAAIAHAVRGDAEHAAEEARRRLRICGLNVPDFHFRSNAAARARLAAAVLVPTSPAGTAQLRKLVCLPSVTQAG